MQSHPSIELGKGRHAPARGHPAEPHHRKLGGLLPNLHRGGGNPSRRHHRDGGARDQSSEGQHHRDGGATKESTKAARDSRTQAPDVSGGMEQTSFSELWHLPLIFELRSLMDDQVFRLARMDQRLDMLFAAHSKNLPQRQCPTCAQTYSLPAGWRQKRNERQRTGK
jgi:hypothetical protein